MGEQMSGITRRIKRLFKKKSAVQPPKRVTASLVLRPEEAIPQHGKLAPKTTRRVRPLDANSSRLTITVLPGGVTHVIYLVELYSVPVRDPVTRRLSRKQLSGGMTKATNYYDEQGHLLTGRDVHW